MIELVKGELQRAEDLKNHLLYSMGIGADIVVDGDEFYLYLKTRQSVFAIINKLRNEADILVLKKKNDSGYYLKLKQ